MNKIEVLQVLRKYPLFTFNEFVRIINKSSEYCRTYLYRLKKEKYLYEIERGKYTVFDDPFAFSSLIVMPSYLSFWTALRFYNVTDQLPINIMVACSKSRKEISFNKTKIIFYKTKNMWGYKKIRYGEFDIFIADIEKCIIDCLLMKNVPFNEIVKAMKSEKADIEKLKRYATKTKNKSLMKRLGYLIEKRGCEADELIPFLDNNYIPFDFNMKKKGEKNKKWRLIVNRSLNDI